MVSEQILLGMRMDRFKDQPLARLAVNKFQTSYHKFPFEYGYANNSIEKPFLVHSKVLNIIFDKIFVNSRWIIIFLL